VDSQIVGLRSFGAEALFIAGTPKFTAQAIRKAHEIDWKPLIVINFISSSVSATLVPAGVENAVGGISGSFYKDPNDAKWSDDHASQSHAPHGLADHVSELGDFCAAIEVGGTRSASEDPRVSAVTRLLDDAIVV
jgi:hypothetical protein